MLLKIKETGEIKELRLIDRKTGKNEILDFIGIDSAIRDGQFIYNGNEYDCDQNTYDWWSKIIKENQELEDRIDTLYDYYPKYFVDAVLVSISDGLPDNETFNLEGRVEYVHKELDEAFEEDAGR